MSELTPKECQIIYNKINIVADMGEWFTYETCINRFFGEHLMHDWQECLSESATKGMLIEDMSYIPYRYVKDTLIIRGYNMLREPTAEELKQCVTLEAHYKVVHDEGGGKYSSCFTGQACDDPRVGVVYNRLDYRIGTVTHDSKPKSEGIFAYEDYERAVRHADGSALMIVQEPTAVLEVKLLKVEHGRTDSVYVVKKVWPDEDNSTSTTADMTSFKVGDYVQVKPEITEPAGSWADVSPGEIGRVISIGVKWITIDFPSQDDWSGVPKELELAERPAPTEEWVDVTKECEVKLVDRQSDSGHKGFKITISHKGLWVIEAGATLGFATYLGYKIEKYGDCSQGGFIVLKKVITEYPV